MRKLKATLKRYKITLTEPRKVVFSIVRNAHAPLLPKDIVTATPLTDRATVYRTLDLFSSVGVFREISIFGNTYYELGPEFTDTHHHHAFCKRCKKIETFASQDLERAIEKLASRHEAKVIDHDFILYIQHANCEMPKAQRYR